MGELKRGQNNRAGVTAASVVNGVPKALSTLGGQVQGIMKSSDVSTLLSKKSNGTPEEKKQSVLSLIGLVTSKDGDVEKKSAILFTLTSESEKFGALDDAIKTIIKHEKEAGELIDLVISRDGQLSRDLNGLVSSYRMLNEQTPGHGAKILVESLGMDAALLIAMKASGIEKGLTEIGEFRKTCSVGPSVEQSFMYGVLDLPGISRIQSGHADSEIRSFLA